MGYSMFLGLVLSASGIGMSGNTTGSGNGLDGIGEGNARSILEVLLPESDRADLERLLSASSRGILESNEATRLLGLAAKASAAVTDNNENFP